MAKGVKRVFIIVLDSLGIGELPDAAKYGDEGSNTLGAIMRSENFYAPTLQSMGLFNIDGVDGDLKTDDAIAAYGRLAEKSKGKDTTIGHWEIAGVASNNPLPTYPDGFPKEIIDEYKKRTGRGVLCNKVYSGTEVIKDYGMQHVQSGDLIVYTSADSVFQVAAHEDVVSLEDLYKYCKIARDVMRGEHAVGRIIARPFNGEYPFKRTPNRHDYSLLPPKTTMLDYIKDNGMSVLAVGKINDIFAGQGVTESHPIKNNANGMEITIGLAERDFKGLCFVNLVDFDMVYGHRNDTDGYAKAVSDFDLQLAELLTKLNNDDVLIITADHGCDPATPSTDHSREYVPLIVYGKKIRANTNLGTRQSFADTAATVLEMLSIDGITDGESYYKEIINAK